MKTNNSQNNQINTDGLVPTLRTHRTERLYQDILLNQPKRTFSDDPSIREWGYWRIIDNIFPYDAAFSVHHLLIPKRLTSEDDLNQKERSELESILKELKDSYSFWMVNFKAKQSIRNHFHIHLLTYKDSREELGF